jgi:hypothetical protein
MLFPALQDWLYLSVTVTLPLVSLITALLAVAPTGRDRPRRA